MHPVWFIPAHSSSSSLSIALHAEAPSCSTNAFNKLLRFPPSLPVTRCRALHQSHYKLKYCYQNAAVCSGGCSGDPRGSLQLANFYLRHQGVFEVRDIHRSSPSILPPSIVPIEHTYMDRYYSRRGVQEHYWMEARDGRPSEVVVYRGPYSSNMDGEHFFQGVMLMCVVYFVARLFFNGLVGILIVGLTVALVIQLLNNMFSSLRPRTDYYARRVY